jgi:hypothetical protein
MMKRLWLFAAGAGLLLVGNAIPKEKGADGFRIVNGYPPCSSTVTDRCIQLYERGVNTRVNLALNEQLPPGRTFSYAAIGAPAPAHSDDPIERMAGTAVTEPDEEAYGYADELPDIVSPWDMPGTGHFHPACSGDSESCAEPSGSRSNWW